MQSEKMCVVLLFGGMSSEHEGLPVPQLIDRLIALALERKEKQHG